MTSAPSDTLPIIIQAKAELFRQHARTIGLNPDDRWVGGYASYEMTHLLPSLKAYGIDLDGKNVLEFGCNVGASAVVLQTRGANVTAVDIDPGFVTLAQLNSAQYGLTTARFDCVKDTRALPYADASFDLIVCNSVLEYVPHTMIAAVQRELNRVLKPGGIIFITGTASRLSPKEVHSGRFLINYLPRFIDPLLGKKDGFQRGIGPRQIRYGFGPGYVNLDAQDQGAKFLMARAAHSSGSRKAALGGFVKVANILGVGPGMLLPSISCVLKKQS